MPEIDWNKAFEGSGQGSQTSTVDWDKAFALPLTPTATTPSSVDWDAAFTGGGFGTPETQAETRGFIPSGIPTPKTGQGNINLNNRPIVRNLDGSISTVKSKSFNFDGKEVLLPTISDDGRELSDQEVVELYKTTGKHLGIFNTPEEATIYAKELSKAQGKQYGQKPSSIMSLQREKGVSTMGISYNPPPIKDTRPEKPIIRAKQPIEDILSRELTPEELANIGIQKETRLLKPTAETLAEAFTGGIIPYNVRPEVQAKHPIASFAGQITGLIAAGELTAPVKYIGALFTKFPALKPLIENTLHGGATFGGKDLSDQIMEITGQDKGTAIDTKRLILNTAIGMGFGASASLPKAISDSVWYRKATIPERQLVVQTVGDLKKAGYSDAEIARMKPEFFKQEFEKRMGTERPISEPVIEPSVPPQKFISPAEQTIEAEQIKMREAQGKAIELAAPDNAPKDLNAPPSDKYYLPTIRGWELRDLGGAKLIPVEGLPPRPSDISLGDWKNILGEEFSPIKNTIKDYQFWRSKAIKLFKDKNVDPTVFIDKANEYKDIHDKTEFIKNKIIEYRDGGGALQDEFALASQLDLAGAQTGLEGKLPSAEIKGFTPLEEATQKGLNASLYHYTDTEIKGDILKKGNPHEQNYLGDGVYLTEKNRYPGEFEYQAEIPQNLKILDLTSDKAYENFRNKVSKRIGMPIERSGQSLYDDLRATAAYSKNENATNKAIRKAVEEISKGYDAIKAPYFGATATDNSFELVIKNKDVSKVKTREALKGQQEMPIETEPVKTENVQKLETTPYKESLGGEGGYVKVGKDTPDVNIQSVKNMDISPVNQALTTLHVADRHPFMKKPIELSIKAVQDTNHIIKQSIEKLTDIFNKAEGKPLFGLIQRRSSGLRDIDLMIEGKKPIPPQLNEFVGEIKGYLEEQRQRVIAKKKADISSHLSPKQQEYLKYLQEGGERPKNIRAVSIAAVNETMSAMKETEKWGKTDYFPHSMKGNYYFLGENGKILAIGETPKQAKFNLMERLESEPSLQGNKVYFVNGLKQMLNARHTLNPELKGTLEQLGTSLSRKQFFSLINKLEDLVDSEIKGAGLSDIKSVKVDMSGIAKMQSRAKFAGNLLKRHTEMRGQEADPFKTLSSYTAAIERHLGLSDAKKALIDFEEGLPPHMENAKSYIKKLRENTLGHYDWANKFIDHVIGGRIGAKPFLLSSVLQKGQGLTANLKLGFAPVKAIINYTDATLSTITKAGLKHWTNGIKILGTKEGKALIEEIGHLAGMEESFAYSHKFGGVQKINVFKPMGLYQLAELKGRSQSVAAAYSQGLEMYGGDIVKAKQHAIYISQLTQGLYDVAAKPVVIQSPVSSTAYQFKQFLNNKVRFLDSLTPKQAAFYIPSILALFGTRGLWLTMKSIIGITIISDIIGGIGEHANEEMNKKYPKAHRGLFGLTGYDISAPGTIQFPREVKDWMGVLYNDAYKTGEMTLKGLKNNGWTDEEISQYINQIAPVGYNIYKGIQLMQTGEIRRGDKLMYRGSKGEGVYNLLGGKTVGQSVESDTSRYENLLKKRQNDQMEIISERILKSKTKAELQKNISEAIKTKGIATPKEMQDFIGGLVSQWKANQLTARERTFKALPPNLKRREISKQDGVIIPNKAIPTEVPEPPENLDSILVKVKGKRKQSGKEFTYTMPAEKALADPELESQREDILNQIKQHRNK